MPDGRYVMAATQPRTRTRLAIQLDPALRHELESAAAQAGVSLEDYVVGVLRDAVGEQAASSARDKAPTAQPSAPPASASAPASDPQRYYESDRWKALARKRRVTLEDVAGILPALPIPVEDMPRIAKEERAVRRARIGLTQPDEQ
jgi:hypothetical protein